MFNNMLDCRSHQVIRGSAIDRANMNGGGSSVSGSISNNGGSGDTVSRYTQSACCQDMVSCEKYQNRIIHCSQ